MSAPGQLGDIAFLSLGSASPSTFLKRPSTPFRPIMYSGNNVRSARFKHLLVRELPKNGDVPKSPLLPIGSPGAVGRHNRTLKMT